MEKLDTDGVTVLDTQAVSFNADEFSYGMLLHAVEGLGNNEAIHYPFVNAGVTITTNDAYSYTMFEGGAGADTFASGIGGHVFYSQSVAAVDVDLDAGTATAGAVVDTWAPGSFGAADGSIFDDTMAGGSSDSWLRGNEGNDLITGQQFHDDLEGGGGNDTINGGDGDDWLFGGAGDDIIDGGLNEGADASKEAYGYEDTLTYSRVVTNHYNALAGPNSDFAQGAEDMTSGIAVIYSGTGAGTITGADTGTDTFTGIELIYGSKFSDIFDASAAGDGDVNIFTGMDGADQFAGSALGFEFVSYDSEVIEATKYYDLFVNYTVFPAFGVIVNMGDDAQIIGGGTIAAGAALDFFGSLDVFGAGIDGVDGTYFSDVLIGNDLNNTLGGLEGADLLAGRQGDDDLWFGDIGDEAGGSLADYTDYRRDGGAGAITVTVGVDGVATVIDSHGDTDTLHGFGNIVGTDGDDSFTGHTGLNRFTGGRGNDTYNSGGALGTGGLSDQISYLFDDAATLGIVFDASGGYDTTITTNGGSFWGTDTLSGYTSIWLEATQNADSLTGGASDDVFLASDGQDTIDGGGGIDALSYADFRTSLRGNGVVYNATTPNAGTVTDGDGDTDTYTNIELLAGSMLGDTFNGSAGDDLFTGHGGNDTFTGGGGIDTVTYAFDASLAFGLGIILEDFELDTGRNAPAAPPHGIHADLVNGRIRGVFENFNIPFNDEDVDTVSGVRNVVGTEFADEFIGDDEDNRFEGLSGADTFSGGLGNDEIIGGDGADTMDGGDGNDTLNGGNGDDSMAGGADNDNYLVSSVGDVVFEDVDEGIDTITTRVEILALAANVENIIMREVADFTGSQSTAVGNGLANSITDNDAANKLDGGNDGLADTLTGRLGNDTYIVNSNDVIVESSGQGTGDRVQALQSFTLAADDNIEFLETANAAGTSGISLTGNGIAQTITGNAGANLLNGGIDAVADTLAGLGGNDTYIINSVTDNITETSTQGTADRAKASVSFTLAAGDFIEFLETVNAAATTAINLTGNSLKQTITGNAGANVLNGGVDALADTLAGLGGNDTYIINSATDNITETTSQGNADRARVSVSFTLATGDYIEFLETINVAATTAIKLTGNSLAQTIIGNNGVNTITGGGGKDTMTGKLGKDTFDFNALSDMTKSGSTTDVITDFTKGQDRIDLSTIDANSKLAGNQAFTLLTTKGAAFTGVAGQLHYKASGANTLIEGDIDGNRSVDFAILLTGNKTLAKTDFIL